MEDFGCHEGGGAPSEVERGRGGRWGKGSLWMAPLGQAKVRDLWVFGFLIYKDIVWFEIAMDHAMLMGSSQSLSGGEKHVEDLRPRARFVL